MADRTIRVTVVGDSRSLQSALKQSESSLKHLDSTAAKSQASLSKMESGLSSFTKGAALLAGASAISAAFLKVVDAASALQSATAANERVFGAQSATMQEAAKAAQDYGLSQAQYLQTSAKLGAQLQNLGMSQESAATSAQSLMRMGENLAAVFGTDVPQAVTAISAALRGEFDPLEQYGVKLTAAKVAAVQSAEGISQAQAVMKLAMEQSAFSVGAAAAAMDTYAGRQRAFAASWDNAQAAIGEGFLPVATAAVDTLGSLANIVGSIPAGVREFAGTVITAAVAVKALQVGMGMLAAKSAAMSAAMTRSQGAFTATIGAYSVDRFSGALTKVGNALPVVGALILGYAEANSYLNDRITEGTVSLEEFGAALAETGQVPAAQFDQITASVQRLSEGTSTLGNVMSMLTLGVGGSLLDKWINADFYAAQTNIDNLNKALTELMAVNPATGAAAVFEMERSFAAAGLSSDHLAGSLVMAQQAVTEVGQEAVDAAGEVNALTSAFDAASQRASAFGHALDALFAGLDVKVAMQQFREQLQGVKDAMKGGLDASEIQGFSQAWRSVSDAMFKSGASTDQIIAQYDKMRASMAQALAEVGVTGKQADAILDQVFGKRRDILITIKANADPANDQAKRSQKVLDSIKQNSPAKILAKWLGGGDTKRADRDIDGVRQNSPATISADPNPALVAIANVRYALGGLPAVVPVVIQVTADIVGRANDFIGSVFGEVGERWDFGEEDVPWLGAQTRMADSLMQGLLGGGRNAAKRKRVTTVVVRLKMEGDWEVAIKELSKLERLATQTDNKGRLTGRAKAARQELRTRRELARAAEDYLRHVTIAYQGEQRSYGYLKRRLDTLRDAMRELASEMASAINAVDIGAAWSTMQSDADAAASEITDLQQRMSDLQRERAAAWNPREIAYYNAEIAKTQTQITNLQRSQQQNTLAKQLDAQLEKTRRFYNAINKLRESGLSDAALQELVRQGADQGADIAEALVGDKSLRQKYNDVFTDAEKFSRSLGDAIANDAYYAKIKEVTDAIDKLEKKVQRWMGRHAKIEVKLNWDKWKLPKAKDLPHWVTDPTQRLQVSQQVNVHVDGPIVDPEGTARAIQRLLRDHANRNGNVQWAGTR